MDLGFIQAAGPASQPVPPGDAMASPNAFKDAAAAFDAALSETLSAAEIGTVRTPATSNTGRTTQPAWLLASLFTATLTGSPAPADAPAEGENATGAKGEVPPVADAAGDGEPVDVTVAADIVIPTPWPADTQPVAVSTGTAQPAHGERAETGNAESTAAAPSDVVPQVQTPLHVAPQPQPSGHAAPQAGARVSANVANAATPSDAAIDGGSGSTAAAASTEIVPATAGIEAVAGDAQQISASRQARPSAAARSGFGEGVTQPLETVRHDAPARAAVAAAQSAVAELTTTAASAVTGIEAARPQQADPSLGHAFAIPSPSSAGGQDAPMTGQDQSNGQGRPTPEFLRFAHALAQLRPAADDSGRAPAAVATASAAAAPAVAAPAAAAAATPTAPAETPGPENVGRLVQAMRVIARPGAWEANVRLNPEHLGDVSIAIRVERNTVSAVVNAEAAGVRQWLEGQEQAVRNGMAEHGLQLDRFIVQRDGHRRDAQPQPQQESRRQSPRRPGTPAERFEIVV